MRIWTGSTCSVTRSLYNLESGGSDRSIPHRLRPCSGCDTSRLAGNMEADETGGTRYQYGLIGHCYPQGHCGLRLWLDARDIQTMV
ncbi:hypothetical protein [Bradyrhizobium sp. JYMT SZCCT0428]|uniref:hypothetical protein n=1 Tax=Bradyrhizobium sp. JYMT SZCCT0428 TaxID=2807673 RepID=UPI001BAA32E2|nr:hypothetical protein [Bradyrhizobium sp. JYMT SZCCT0428]MBR1154590.1 hypothetical protein [Bradyrhizobium sp. JYMT SZCCT0428]